MYANFFLLKSADVPACSIGTETTPRRLNSSPFAMTVEQDPSPRTRAALHHLCRIRPLDGYAVECYLASNGRNQVRLKRR